MVKNIEDGVKYVLAQFPEARNNDIYLIMKYWRIFDKVSMPGYVFYEILRKATHFETIRRTRQKIQAEGKYLPCKTVLESRRKSQGEITEWTKK